MLKKIKEPLANYEKKPVADKVGGKTSTAKQSSGRKGMSWKVMGSLAALIVFIGVGAAGILTAQRQYGTSELFAPNAPESKPGAAEAPTGLFNATCVPGSSYPTYQILISEIDLKGGEFLNSNVFISMTYSSSNPDIKKIRDFLGRSTYEQGDQQLKDGDWFGYNIHVFNSYSGQLGFTWNNAQRIGGNQKTLAELSQFIRDNNIQTPLNVGANLAIKTIQNDWIGGKKLNVGDPTCGGSGGGGSTGGNTGGSTADACSLTFTVAEEPQTLLNCNDICDNTKECQQRNPDWICSIEEGNRCRLADNPSSEECLAVVPTYDCDSNCTTTEQCQSYNKDYICSKEYGNVCRLATAPSSRTCTAPYEELDCNSGTCGGDDQCQEIDEDYICSEEYNNTCRLKTNPSSPTCEAVQTGNAQCNSKIVVDYEAGENTVQSISEKSVINKGDQFSYIVEIESKRLTAGDVVLTDTLPTGISYVDGSATLVSTGMIEDVGEEITPTVTGQKLTFNLGTFSSSRTVLVQYQVQAAADIAVGDYTNKAVVTTAGTAASNCTATVDVPATAEAICEEKVALTDYDGEQISLSDTTVDPGDSFVYKIIVSASEVTAGQVSLTDILPKYIKFVDSDTDKINYTEDTNTVSADLGTMSAGQEELAFKVQLASNALPGKYVNEAVVETGTADGYTCPATIKVSEFECNDTCTTDAQCQSANADYICSADNGDRCRLDTNRASSTCQPKTFACDSSCSSDSDCQSVNDDYVCADVEEGKRCRLEDYIDEDNCQSPNPTPTPTPAPGCNDECNSNSDCTNPDHICYTTDDGNKCRLADYVNSESCTKPTTKVTTTTQPDLPQELPQTGPEDWVNWLKAGLITLGIGALLLLLL